jgi:hypothetical protein
MSIIDPDLVINIAPADAAQFNLTSLGVVSIQGANPFGTVEVAFTQPAIGQSVQVTFDSTGWVGAGQAVLIDVGGTYAVQSVDSTAQATLVNLGYAGNALPDSLIIQGSLAHPAGFQGIVGPIGLTGEQGPKGDKGDAALDMSTFKIDAGSSATFSVQLIQQDGTLTNLNPDKVQTVQFIAKRNETDPDSDALWNKVVTNTGTLDPGAVVQIINADTGLIRVTVTGNDSQPLAGGTTIICFVRTTSPEGVRETPAEFSLLIV